MSNWTAAEIRQMLSITAERIIKKQLTGTVKDGMLYEKVAEELSKRGIRREKKQVVSKLKNLRKKFNDGRMDWEHLEVCHAIWGSRYTANPQHVQASLDHTRADSPTPDTPESVETNAEEERDDAGSQSGESQTEQAPPPAKKKRTTTKAQAVAEDLKELLATMERNAEKEQARLERQDEQQRSDREEEKRRWEQEISMREAESRAREAERRARDEQFGTLSNLFVEMNREMQSEFALLRETISRIGEV